MWFSGYEKLAWWLSWLERRPVTAEVVGSNPIRVALFLKIRTRNLSSAGRASALHAEGHRFESCRFHLSVEGRMLVGILPMWLNWQSSCFVISRLSVRVRSSALTFISGGIPEWPKGTDCKSAGSAFSGSNPLSPT